MHTYGPCLVSDSVVVLLISDTRPPRSFLLLLCAKNQQYPRGLHPRDASAQEGLLSRPFAPSCAHACAACLSPWDGLVDPRASPRASCAPSRVAQSTQLLLPWHAVSRCFAGCESHARRAARERLAITRRGPGEGCAGRWRCASQRGGVRRRRGRTPQFPAGTSSLKRSLHLMGYSWGGTLPKYRRSNI